MSKMKIASRKTKAIYSDIGKDEIEVKFMNKLKIKLIIQNATKCELGNFLKRENVYFINYFPTLKRD